MSTIHRWHETVELIRRALAEDLVIADATTRFLPSDLEGEAMLIAKQQGVVAGAEVALQVFREVDPSLETEVLTEDGSSAEKGTKLVRIYGNLGSILQAERTATNFLQRLSGIATATRAYVDAIADLPAVLIDTRKTLPGWRHLDKYAVRAGGGRNHRMNLADGVLIKDNHIEAMALLGVGLTELVRIAREKALHTIRIEVEVDTLAQVPQALDGGADIILLDNMDIATMRQAVALCKGRALTEASGNITLENIRAIAETGVDLLSSGSVTHSVRALDISLDVTPILPSL
jgi:nicotinate-nucleotide pyrophosphorylase (carboxylating)